MAATTTQQTDQAASAKKPRPTLSLPFTNRAAEHAAEATDGGSQNFIAGNVAHDTTMSQP